MLVGAGIAAFNVDAIRIPLVNWLVHVQETHTDIHFLPEGDDLPEIQFGYLPEGYILESTDILTSFNVYYLSNGIDDPISITQSDLHTGYSLDTEGVDVSNIVLENGQTALTAEKNGLAQITWSSSRYSFLAKGKISIHELVKIAENIK